MINSNKWIPFWSRKLKSANLPVNIKETTKCYLHHCFSNADHVTSYLLNDMIIQPTGVKFFDHVHECLAAIFPRFIWDGSRKCHDNCNMVTRLTILISFSLNIAPSCFASNNELSMHCVWKKYEGYSRIFQHLKKTYTQSNL